MKFPFTFGFEMTGIYRHYRERKLAFTYKGWSATVANMNAATSIMIGHELKRIYPKSFQTKEYVDGHCIEFPSPVFTDSDEADRFYIILSDMMARYNYGPKHATTVCGGGHLHFGMTKQEQIAQIVRFCYDHPWIVWAFTQPDDTDTSDNCTSSCYPYVLCSNTFAEKGRFGNIDHCFEHFCYNKDLGVVGNQHDNGAKTIEYRCVEAPLNLSEFQDQYRFFTALTVHALSLSPIKPLDKNKIRTNEELQQITLKEAILGFEKLCIDLNIPSSRYDKYVKRNLMPRFDEGMARN